MIKKRNFIDLKGFTLVELVVSLGIFALITTLLLAKYGSFNQSVLLTNLAYDVALAIRTAQSYGINVKSAPTGGVNYSNQFNYAYGVHFDAGSPNDAATPGGPLIQKDQFVIFADLDGDNFYDDGEAISTYSIKRGSYVYHVCVGTQYASCTSGANRYNLSLTFRRPDPKAFIKSRRADVNVNYKSAQITLRSDNGTTKKVIVNELGQISITD